MPMTIPFRLHQSQQTEKSVEPVMPPTSHQSLRYVNRESDRIGLDIVSDYLSPFAVEIPSNPVPD